MSFYSAIADLPVAIDGFEHSRRERATTSDFTRVTTVVTLHGDGETGMGEDVTYDEADHVGFDDVHDSIDIEGTYTVDSFSSRLDSQPLFPDTGPVRPVSSAFRRWAFESAALDLALRQAGTTLGKRLERPVRPVRFVVSTRLGDPPTIDRIERVRSIDPGVEFKLDPTPEWSPSLIESIADADGIRILDFKGRYEPESVSVANPPDPDLYRRVLASFPDAIVEDPADSEDIGEILREFEPMVSWDYPIRAVEDVRSLPQIPDAINIKPSRFGSVKSLFETIEYCLASDIDLYGGGQFELDVGRGQIQTLAALFYSDSPNDVAPRGYNDPDPDPSLPRSPLETPSAPVGFR